MVSGSGSVWLERLVRDQEVGGSNPPFPTRYPLKKQIHAFYSGRVQGVGFRFTAREVADELGVLGWVKNLHDGMVEVLAEAEEEVLKEFLERINRCFSRYIQDTDIDWLAATGEFRDFGIQF